MSNERKPANPGELFVLSAPSGTGKTTLIKELYRRSWPDGGAPEFSVSHTTRPPRPGEIDGIHYHFVDEEKFDAMIAADAFLEWAMVHGQRKGTAREEVTRRLVAGTDVLLDVDVQGAANVLEVHPGACAVFILPPSYAELKRRIAGRGHDHPEDVERRLAVSLWEIERYAIYDYVIINDDIERASAELAAIVVARHSLRDRREQRIAGILEDFRTALDPGHSTSLGGPVTGDR